MDLSKYKEDFYQKVVLESGEAILYKDKDSNDVKYDLYNHEGDVIHTSSTFQNIEDLLNNLNTITKDLF